MNELRVRAPATSANLGPGFDSFAIALPILAEFEARPARSWAVTVEGDGDGIPTGDENLFVVGARAAAKAAKGHLPPHHVTQRSSIPGCRGLGSSAARVRLVRQPAVRRTGAMPEMRADRAWSMSGPRYQSPVWSRA